MFGIVTIRAGPVVAQIAQDIIKQSRILVRVVKAGRLAAGGALLIGDVVAQIVRIAIRV